MLGNIIRNTKELRNRWQWSKNADRLGPDMIGTYFSFYLPTKQLRICQQKFKFFGDNAEFRMGAYAVQCSNIKIGHNVVIRPTTILMASEECEIDIREDVLIGSGVHIYVSNHKFDNVNVPIYNQGHSPCKSVLIKEGCWIGANAIILPGVTIGRNAVVAAGSIVNKDVDDFTLVGGNPARLIKNLR